jgi:predicted Zn-dependent protease
MIRLTGTDQRHFESAQGWLELGDWRSANEELENIQPQMRAHPDVLKMRVEVYSAAKKWDYVIEVAGALSRLLPDHVFGHVRLAYALHELKRTREAWNVLLPIADKFPTTWIIPYNLACYAVRLGDLVAARDWLAQAFRLGNAKEIKVQALDDPDLAPLWLSKEQD